MSEIYIIFDGPPSHESGRFVEVEDGDGKGLGPEQTGADWTKRGDGLWQLGPFANAQASCDHEWNAPPHPDELLICAKCGKQSWADDEEPA